MLQLMHYLFLRVFDAHVIVGLYTGRWLTNSRGASLRSCRQLPKTVSEDQDEVYDYSYECSTWNGTNDEPCSLAMEIDECEVVTSEEDIQELFTRDAKPDEEEYEVTLGMKVQLSRAGITSQCL